MLLCTGAPVGCAQPSVWCAALEGVVEGLWEVCAMCIGTCYRPLCTLG